MVKIHIVFRKNIVIKNSENKLFKNYDSNNFSKSTDMIRVFVVGQNSGDGILVKLRSTKCIHLYYTS